MEEDKKSTVRVTEKVELLSPPFVWKAPTQEQIESTEFNLIWKAIKTWDIQVPEAYVGPSGSTGNHVVHILGYFLPYLKSLKDTKTTLRNHLIKAKIENNQIKARSLESCSTHKQFILDFTVEINKARTIIKDKDAVIAANSEDMLIMRDVVKAQDALVRSLLPLLDQSKLEVETWRKLRQLNFINTDEEEAKKMGMSLEQPVILADQLESVQPKEKGPLAIEYIYQKDQTQSEEDTAAWYWWNQLPLQNLRDAKDSKAGYCMKYHPEGTDCNSLSKEEIINIWKQEHQKEAKTPLKQSVEGSGVFVAGEEIPMDVKKIVIEDQKTEEVVKPNESDYPLDTDEFKQIVREFADKKGFTYGQARTHL